MSSSITSPRLPPVPVVSPAAPVSPAAADRLSPATDLLLITSSTDFPGTTKLLNEAAATAGIRLDTIFIEDLEGSNPGEKLSSLHRLMGESVACGKVQPATVIYISLHGRATPIDFSLDAYLGQQQDLRHFVFSLGQDSARTAAQAGDAAAREPSETVPAGDDADSDDSSGSGDEGGIVHMMSADRNALVFPSILLFKAARYAAVTAQGFEANYQGTIFVGSCDAGGMSEQLVADGGDYVVLNGKKGGLSSDADDCMLEVIGMMAERRQQQLPPLGGREYWMHLRNVSGEHIAYVGETGTEIHKVLEAGHCEPVLVVRNSQAAGQPARVLNAKLLHGSPMALEAVFTKYGPDLLADLSAAECFSTLAMDVYRSRSELEEKIGILERHGVPVPDDPDGMAALLEDVICYDNHAMLGILLSRRIDDRLPPAVLQSARTCIFENPNVAEKLQALCEGHPFLRLVVANWLEASINAIKSNDGAGRFDVSTALYFGSLLFGQMLLRSPRPLRQSLEKYYPQASKPKLRAQILNTVVWEDLPSVWNLAKKLVAEFRGGKEEMDELIRLTPLIFPAKPRQ